MMEARPDDCGLCTGDFVQVPSVPGVAFTVRGHPVEVTESWVALDDPPGQDGYWEDEEEILDGQVVAVMVGDDQRHVFDVEDVTALPEEEFCGGCGQIGCGHGGI